MKFRPYQQDGVQSYGFHWWCPGCDTAHGVPVQGPNAWGFEGTPDNPTLSPSVLVNGGQQNPGCPVCHCYVRAGKIQFLSDCTHELAGQTVEIPDFPEHWG